MVYIHHPSQDLCLDFFGFYCYNIFMSKKTNKPFSPSPDSIRRVFLEICMYRHTSTPLDRQIALHDFVVSMYDVYQLNSRALNFVVVMARNYNERCRFLRLIRLTQEGKNVKMDESDEKFINAFFSVFSKK